MDFRTSLAAGLGIGAGIVAASILAKIFPVLLIGGIGYGISKLIIAAGQETDNNGNTMDK